MLLQYVNYVFNSKNRLSINTVNKKYDSYSNRIIDITETYVNSLIAIMQSNLSKKIYVLQEINISVIIT